MSELKLPRLRFAHLPTPIEPMPRLSAHLGGPHLWIKRDDQTGLAFGGNKTRKLEYLLAEAQANGAHSVFTRGAAQSNHCRQTAAAAARFGLACTLVLAGEPPHSSMGNLLLDSLLGAELVWAQDQNPEIVLQEQFDQAWAQGRRPFLIPRGGSSPTGAAAYAAAMQEFLEQGIQIDRIVLASSSGGTQAGMLAGARAYGYEGAILGICVDIERSTLKNLVAELANQILDLMGLEANLAPANVDVEDGYVGDGYGVMGSLERDAVSLFAQQEGILLDPVYTARAAGGMIDLIHRGVIPPDERVLFWHTGGTPSLFAYAEELLQG